MAGIDSIWKTIKDLDNRIKKLESYKQPVSADIVQIVSSDLSAVNTGSVSAGATAVITITISPAAALLTLWNLLFSIYVDTDNDANYLYPSGGSLTAGQKNFTLQVIWDYAGSNDSTGSRVVKIVIKNGDSGAHTYYVRSKYYGIKQEL
jgi:hypothetical protein